MTITGAFWGLGALLAAWALFNGKGWAPSFARWGMAAYALWYWADRLLLVRSDYARETLPASIATTVVLLSAGYGTLQVTKVQQYYREEKG